MQYGPEPYPEQFYMIPWVLTQYWLHYTSWLMMLSSEQVGRTQLLPALCVPGFYEAGALMLPTFQFLKCSSFLFHIQSSTFEYRPSITYNHIDVWLQAYSGEYQDEACNAAHSRNICGWFREACWEQPLSKQIWSHSYRNQGPFKERTVGLIQSRESHRLVLSSHARFIQKWTVCGRPCHLNLRRKLAVTEILISALIH